MLREQLAAGSFIFGVVWSMSALELWWQGLHSAFSRERLLPGPPTYKGTRHWEWLLAEVGRDTISLRRDPGSPANWCFILGSSQLCFRNVKTWKDMSWITRDWPGGNICFLWIHKTLLIYWCNRRPRMGRWSLGLPKVPVWGDPKICRS